MADSRESGGSVAGVATGAMEGSPAVEWIGDKMPRDCLIGPRQHIDWSYQVCLMAKPGITLHRLELFLSVLDTGGVAKPARARRSSQPAVPEHLRGLEEYLGVALLERGGRGVRPTAAARALEPFARQAVELLRHAERAAEELRGVQAGA